MAGGDGKVSFLVILSLVYNTISVRAESLSSLPILYVESPLYGDFIRADGTAVPPNTTYKAFNVTSE
ncbi:hypothetical protein SK128_021389, partial [Halocaridina rubra]